VEWLECASGLETLINPDMFITELMNRVRAVLAGDPSLTRETPAVADADEKESLELYSATLIRKLEEKTLQLEEANRVLQQEILECKKANTVLRDRAAQRMESSDTLAGSMAHDLNNILAPILMGVSYLKRVETNEKILAVIENIEKSANRGTALVRQVVSAAEPREAAVTAPSAVTSGNGELILIADDEAPILEIMQGTLESYGYRVLIAENGARALELYDDHRDEISLVITDMKMPIMDGAALIAALRRSNRDVKIISMSGLNDGSYDASGAVAFIRKPFSADQLLSLLQSVVTG
jgi:CheY-like chemotaxis protein